MANELLITDIVDQKAFTQINMLSSQLIGLKTTMSELIATGKVAAKEMLKGLSFNPTDLDGLYKKNAAYNDQQKKLIEVENKLKETQKQYEDVLKKVNVQVREAVRQAKEKADLDLKMAKAAQAQEKTEQAKYQTLIKEIQAERALDNATKSRTVTEAQITEALNTQARSIKEAQVQNRVLRQAVVQVILTEENASQKIEAYNKKIDENSDLINKNSDAMLKRKQNIGNYASAFDGLGMSVQQIVRELPSAAIGLNTFFLAISNNLPILADEIARARQELKLMNEQGLKGTPVWKQLVSSLFSWQTAMIAGITILSMHGKEIGEWVMSLFKGKEALVETYHASEEFQKSVSESSAKMIAEIERLSQGWISLGGNLKAQEKYILDNKEAFDSTGYAVRNVADAENLLVTNKDAFIDAVIEKAKSTAVMELAAKEYEKYIKMMLEADEMAEKISYTSVQGNKPGGVFNPENWVTVSFDNPEKAKAIKKAEEYRGDIVKLIQKALGIDEKSKEEIKKAGGKAESELIEGSVRAIESAISAKRDALKDATNPEEYQKIISEIEKYQEQLDNITGSGKEAEDYAKYMLDIEKKITEATINAITDRKEREIAEINAEYDEKEAAIKGNSEKETQLRVLLTEERVRKIKEAETEYERDIRETNLNNMMAYEKEGSDAMLAYRIELLELQREKEVEEAEKTGASVLEVNRKYDAMIKKEKEEMASQKADKIMADNASISFLDGHVLNEQMRELSEAYKNGNISKEQYEAENYRIQQEYAQKQIQSSIDTIKSILNNEELDLSDDDRIRYEEQLAQAQIDLDNMVTDNKIENDKKQMESEKEKRQKQMELMQQVSSLLSTLGEFGDQLFQNRIDQLDEENESNQEAYDKEIENIEKLEESGAISTEEAEARKRAAEDKTKAKEEEIAKKKAELQRKQAIYDKAMNIAQVGMATALGIMKASPNLVLMALIGAMGAVQLATILATPIPKYKEGTDYHKGGLAIVGDGGVPETVLTPDGKLYLTPAFPTLTELPIGTKVFPENIYEDEDKYVRSDALTLMDMRDGDGLPIVMVQNDYSGLERRIDKLERSIIKAFEKAEKESKKARYEAFKSRI